MNGKNSKTNETHRFRLDLPDKLNVKNPKQKNGLNQFEYFYTLGQTSSQNTATINSNFLL